MNKSLKVTTIILSIIVIGLIAFIFIRNNACSNAIPDSSVATADDQSVSADSNFYNNAYTGQSDPDSSASSYVSGDDQAAAAVKATATSSLLSTYQQAAPTSAVLKAYYSVVYPEGSAMSSSNSSNRFDLYPNLNKNDARNGWNAAWNALASQSNKNIMTSTSECQHPVSIALASALSDTNAITGSNAQIMTTARRYVDWNGTNASGNLLFFMNGEFNTQPGTVRHIIFPVIGLGYCLDNNYVSNYPAYVDNLGSFLTARGFSGLMNVFLTATTIGKK